MIARLLIATQLLTGAGALGAALAGEIGWSIIGLTLSIGAFAGYAWTDSARVRDPWEK